MQGMTSNGMRLSNAIGLSAASRSCAKWVLLSGLVVAIAPTGLEYATLTSAAPSPQAESHPAASPEGSPAQRAHGGAARPMFGFVLKGSPAELDEEQHNVAHFLASRYRRSADQVRHFVSHAYQSAASVKLDPWLVLAVMAVESGFDPFAESGAGAQGLMQILTRVNLDRLAPFGGAPAVFDPVANIRVGTDILHMLLNRNGSIEGALKSYVGAANLPSDGGYSQKVLGVRDMIAAAAGVKAPAWAASVTAAVRAAPRPGDASESGSSAARDRSTALEAIIAIADERESGAGAAERSPSNP
jgi:soluble lytic murein transglycosylase-like protein